jgi:hypothetical protein
MFFRSGFDPIAHPGSRLDAGTRLWFSLRSAEIRGLSRNGRTIRYFRPNVACFFTDVAYTILVVVFSQTKPVGERFLTEVNCRSPVGGKQDHFV